MSDLLHLRGRWVTMTTASRCVHHVSLADSCAPCGETGMLSEFSDALLLAECDRRRLFAPVVVADAPAPEGLEPGKVIHVAHAESLPGSVIEFEQGLDAAREAGAGLRESIAATAAAPKFSEKPKKGRK